MTDDYEIGDPPYNTAEWPTDLVQRVYRKLSREAEALRVPFRLVYVGWLLDICPGIALMLLRDLHDGVAV